MPRPGLWNCRILFATAASFCALCAVASRGESDGKSQIGGFVVPRTTIPAQDPRPAEGDAPDERLSSTRPPDDMEPVGSFIDSLKANDAAFEVLVGQGRLLTTRRPIAMQDGAAVVAVGDPTVIDFEILPNPQMIRVTGKRIGVTDISITTAGGETYAFEVHVTYDLELLRAQLRQLYPDARLKLAQMREHVVVEGQARSAEQVARILETINLYLQSVQVEKEVRGQEAGLPPAGAPGYGRGDGGGGGEGDGDGEGPPPAQARGEPGGRPDTSATFQTPQIINLIRVPGVQQVLLQVRIAELNRTALREIGADILGVDPDTGNMIGTTIAGSTVNALGTLGLGGLVHSTETLNGPNATAFGIFPSGDFEIILRALRRNQVLNILAEPNLMAMSGHTASFLAGGQFPVPVPQGGGTGFNNVTIQFKDFGVQLDFVPYVLDEEQIRLSVSPEVSSIDFSLGTVLVQGGTPVPGLNTRKATTTVELREGQSLAIAGLLQVTIDGSTNRIPGLGDLPYIGPLFSNTSHNRQEKELVVLVTPFLVEAMEADEVPPMPGDDMLDPNDCEFYFLNRIEGRTGQDIRATTTWDDPLCMLRHLKLERKCLQGPIGYSD